MKRRSVLVLAVLVAALGAFVFFYERRQPSHEERVAAGRKLLELEPGSVTSLAIERSGRPGLRLERGEGERWRMTEPEARRADSFAVDRLLRTLAELERKRTLEDAAPADLGLDAPRFKLSWTTAAGSDSLLVGATVPGSGDTLVALASRPGLGFVAAGAIAGELDRDPEGWRDRRLFPGERSAIDRMRVIGASGGPPIILERRGESFRLVAPIDDVPERDLVEGLLGELTAASAQSFVAAGEGFTGSGAAVEVEFSGGASPFRLELGPATGVGEGTPILVRASSGGESEVARMVTRLATTVALDPEQWRSRSWTSLASYDIEGVEARGTGAPVVLRREGVDWRRGAEKVSYTEVSDFLAALTAAGAERLETGSSESAGTSRTGGDESAGTSWTIELAGPKGAREILGLRGDRATNSARPGVTLWLSPEQANEVRRTLERVRDAKPVAE